MAHAARRSKPMTPRWPQKALRRAPPENPRTDSSEKSPSRTRSDWYAKIDGKLAQKGSLARGGVSVCGRGMGEKPRDAVGAALAFREQRGLPFGNALTFLWYELRGCGLLDPLALT